MKYPSWKGPENEGRVEALLNIVGEANAEAMLRGILVPRFEFAPGILFDGSGRRIPRDLTAYFCDLNRSFYLGQPALLFAERLMRLQEFFPAGTRFVSAAEFEDRISTLLHRIQSDRFLSNVLKGPHFPVCLPQIEAGDYGEILDRVFAEAVGRSYREQFAERKFNNHRRGSLARQTKVVHQSHQRLIGQMTKSPLVGLLFVPLQGFSVHAQREQMAGLPDFVSLAGGFDLATAMTGYPDVLARDFNTPGLDMAALQWQSAEDSLFFRAYGDGLYFDGRDFLGGAHGDYSGGLFLLG